MTDVYDLIAIRSGPAGESAVELASFFGHRCAVIEKARPGGTVTTTGGAPTKTLREAALYFSGLVEGDVYGIRISAPPEVATDDDPQAHSGRLRSIATGDSGELRKEQRRLPRGLGSARHGRDCDRHRPRRTPARAPRENGADCHGISSQATADHPFELAGVCDTDTILNRSRVPKDMLIVGAGSVGVEFATIAHALGARVTLADSGNRLLATMDEEMTGCMEEVFQAYGIRVLFGSTCNSIVAKDGGLAVENVLG